MRPRLYLDEDVLPELARIARSAGEDVTSVHEIGATGLDDPTQLQRATDDGRAILTWNYVDFVRIDREWRAAGRRHAGIIVSYRQYSSDQVADLWSVVRSLLESLDAEHIAGTVISLDAFRHRG